jgi:UDP-N-acetylmuramyl pentapeptide synthase
MPTHDEVHLDVIQPSPSAWSADMLAAATGGEWIVAPKPGWMAAGIVRHFSQFQPHSLLCRWNKEGGLNIQQITRLAPQSAGIMCEEAPDESLLHLGIPVLLVKGTTDALIAMATYARRAFRGLTIGVTGSSGKTSTTYMLGEMLSLYGSSGFSRGSGNMARVIAMTMASMPTSLDFWILEMAYPDMKTIAPVVRPHIAIVTSISEAHLKGLYTLQRMAQFKSRIFSGLEEDGTALLCREMNEFETVKAAAKKNQARIITYGTSDDCDVRLESYTHGEAQVTAFGTKMHFATAISGHNLINALTGIAIVYDLGYPLEKCLHLLRTYREIPGRGRRHTLRVAGGKQITLIDDSYNANIGSMQAAIRNLQYSASHPENRVAFLGDIAELGPENEVAMHLRLVEPLMEAGIDRLVFFGPIMRNVYERVKTKIKGAWFATPEELIADALSWLQNGDVVLVKSSGHKLSPLVEQLLKSGENVD